MDPSGPRTPVGVFLSLPIAGLLVLFFFMPWVTLSCDPKGIIPPEQLAKMPPQMMSGAEAKEIAHASGWELARGEISPAEDCPATAQAPSRNDEFPKPKYWVYLCLAVPAGLLIASFMGLSGNLSCRGAGRAMLLGGLAGVGLMIAAASIDYVDDAIDHVKADAAKAAPGAVFAGPGVIFDHSVAEAGDKMKQVLKTKATWYLWGSLGLYGVSAVLGLMTLAAPQSAPSEWRQDRVQARAPQDPIPPLSGLRQGEAPLPRGEARSPRVPHPSSGSLPDFGPDITSSSPSKTNNPARFRDT